MVFVFRTDGAQVGPAQPSDDAVRPLTVALEAAPEPVQGDLLEASGAPLKQTVASTTRLARPEVCRATSREASPQHVTPANLADVLAAARRNGVDVNPQVFTAARDVLVKAYNDDYRACDVPMYCYDFSLKMRDDLRARFPQANAELIELHPHDASNGVNHYVVRANFGQGPVIFDATADQFELLEGRPRIGPQLRSEADYTAFIHARGYGSPRVVSGD